MKTFEFEKTSIPSQFSINMKDNYGHIWVDERTADLYRVLFATITDVLKFNQSKEHSRIGFILKDDKGNFKFGAVLNYNKPEEGSEEDSGNWYLEFTFDSADMIDLDVELDNHSDVFVRSAANQAMSICYGKFRTTEMMYNTFNCAIDTLIEFLDTNASEVEEMSVNLRGIFTASVAIEDGIKVMSIVPGESIKQAIKSDVALG